MRQPDPSGAFDEGSIRKVLTMKAIAGAIVILAGAVLSGAGAIAEAVPKIADAIPPGSARSAAYMGFALMLMGAAVMGVGLRSKSD
jgi:hypothetical protein